MSSRFTEEEGMGLEKLLQTVSQGKGWELAEGECKGDYRSETQHKSLIAMRAVEIFIHLILLLLRTPSLPSSLPTASLALSNHFRNQLLF